MPGGRGRRENGRAGAGGGRRETGKERESADRKRVMAGGGWSPRQRSQELESQEEPTGKRKGVEESAGPPQTLESKPHT